jgi:hypothetical protein
MRPDRRTSAGPLRTHLPRCRHSRSGTCAGAHELPGLNHRSARELRQGSTIEHSGPAHSRVALSGRVLALTVGPRARRWSHATQRPVPLGRFCFFPHLIAIPIGVDQTGDPHLGLDRGSPRGHAALTRYTGHGSGVGLAGGVRETWHMCRAGVRGSVGVRPNGSGRTAAVEALAPRRPSCTRSTSVQVRAGHDRRSSHARWLRPGPVRRPSSLLAFLRRLPPGACPPRQPTLP